MKMIHLACAALSFTGFFLRGVWMLRGSEMLGRRWVRIAPQVIDTLLLASAVVLAVQLRLSPLAQPWLMTKIIALVGYIGVGLVALRLGRSRGIRLLAWVSGLVLFLYIVSVAFSRSPLGWFSLV